MNNQLELLKWLKEQLQRTDIEFGNEQRSRITLEDVDAYGEDEKRGVEDNINRLRFRYRWIEEQIQSLNKQ